LKKEIKHPKGHNCPDGLVYSDKKGKCINPKLEDGENLNECSREDGKRGIPHSLSRTKKVS